MNNIGEAGGWLLIAGALLFVVLVACWVVLPLAVIGTKPLLRQLLAEQRRTNELLDRLGLLVDERSTRWEPPDIPR